ncbi:SOS response-associated peptidase family protein [Flavobacterium sp. Arc2]|uniref:SOS response-associated peptidase family protein n=1 Tax=Flavobacterium sp. Arc2 TaxID=3046685 RepID=UPI00352CC32A
MRANYHWTLQLGSNSGMGQKLSFKNSVDKRCLVIANGYYEWQWLDPKGKAKQKYELRLPYE